ncbi:uncharacterized protein LOC121375075 [Gigantopelta aegis]|uniref:uncharacterized protein LOC121375075 n=1 Tax=Gigantopelta aegis TaxID=1735272 RepID=UPI001B8874AC|nr:uncharacterized protein LOC121375075 [Gigantopelta aegis]XP_041358238.1 uncharacterized protein LOC121375075 [Gigantopelta aegis]
MSDKPSTEEQQSERLFIQGYQVFCNDAGQPDSGNSAKPPGDSPAEKDPDDLPVTFEVKTEPVDADYETSTSPASASSPASMPVMTLPTPRPRPQLKDVLPRLKQMQQMNASANVIDELLKKNEFLLGKKDFGGYKPYSRRPRIQSELKRPENLMEANPQTFLVSPTSQARISATKPELGPKIKDARYGKILRPRSPTRKCSIPEKDKSHFNYALIESSVKDKSSDKIFKVQKHEMVCAVTCKAMFMTQGGAIKGDFDLQFYWCNFCTFHTTNKAQLVQHGMEHRFHCKFCRYQSFSRADIIHHSAKEHVDAFRETASSMKYCILLSDYLQIYSQDTDEDRKKRAAPEDDDEDDGPPQKAAKLEGRSVDSLSPDELKTLQNDYQIFDMEVETVDETDKNAVSEESSPLASASVDVPSDRQIIASSGLATYETPKAMNNIGIAESSLQSTMLQNTMPVSRTPPIPVSLVAANNRPVLISRLPTPILPVGQLLVQNIANSTVRPAAGSAIQSQLTSIAPSLLQTHRLMDSRPPPPPPSNKPKPGQGSTVSSSLYWSCGYCSFTSHSQSEIKEHSQKSHRGKPHRYVALIMPSDKQSQNGQNAEGAKDINEANITNKNIEIDNAEDLSDSVPMERESESFKCFHCSFLVKKPDLIKDHLFSKHPSLSMVGVDIHSKRLKNIFYCPRDDCPFRSKSPALFQSHVERCTPWQMKDLNIAVEKHLLDCLENTIKFSKAVQLKEQVSTNLGELSCIYCIFKSHFPSRVKHHVMTKHPLRRMVIRAHSNHEGLSCLIHFCTLCSWHTRIKCRRRKHLLSAHNIQNVDICDGSIQIYSKDPFENPEYAVENKDDIENVSSPLVEQMLEQDSYPFYIDSKNDTIYRCPFCFLKCMGISEMKSHLQKKHPSHKMQTVNVEKCINEEECVFFLCPEEMCSVLCAKESLLIRHAQSHKSMCVSPTVLDPNYKIDPHTKTYNDKPEMTIREHNTFDAQPTLQDADVKCLKPVVSQSALFSCHSINSADNNLMHSECLMESTLKTTPYVPPGHCSGNTQHITSVPHSIGNTQNIPSVLLNIGNIGSIGKRISSVPLIIGSTQNISSVPHIGKTPNIPSVPLILGNKKNAQSVPLSIGNTQNIPSVLVQSLNTANLVVPNVQSLPSVLPPCPGGIRIALWRTTLDVPAPCLYPQLGPTVMTNAPFSTRISKLNASEMLLAMVPPASKKPAEDNTVHVEILQVPRAEQGVVTKLTESPLNLPTCSQTEVHQTDARLENCIHSNICQSDGEENDQKLKIVSVNSLAYNVDPVKEEELVEPDKPTINASPQLMLDETTIKITSCTTNSTVDGAEKIINSVNNSLVESNILDNDEVHVEMNRTISNQMDLEQKSLSVKRKTLEIVSKTRLVCDPKEIGKDFNLDLKDSSSIDDVCNIDQMNPSCGAKDDVGSVRRLAQDVKKKSDMVNPERFSCKFCEFSALNGVLAIKSHINDNHPDEKFETCSVDSNSGQQKTYFLCPSETCTFCITEESVLVTHWMCVHEDESEGAAEVERAVEAEGAAEVERAAEAKGAVEAEETSNAAKQNVTEESTSHEKNKSPKAKIKFGYECLYCSVSYIDLDLKSMKRHYDEKHQGQDMIMRDLKVGSLRNSRIVVCNHQDCTYIQKGSKNERFQYHQLAHNNSKIYECPSCKWFSDDRSATNKHLKTHSKKHNPGYLLEFSLKLEPDGRVSKTAIKCGKAKIVN